MRSYTVKIRIELDARAEFGQPLSCQPERVIAYLVNQIASSSKNPRKSIRQCPQNAGRKSAVASTTLDNGPLFRSLQLLKEFREITSEGCGKEFAALRTRAKIGRASCRESAYS